jgi:hypothetical protein
MIKVDAVKAFDPTSLSVWLKNLPEKAKYFCTEAKELVVTLHGNFARWRMYINDRYEVLCVVGEVGDEQQVFRSPRPATVMSTVGGVASEFIVCCALVTDDDWRPIYRLDAAQGLVCEYIDVYCKMLLCFDANNNLYMRVVRGKTHKVLVESNVYRLGLV